MKTKLVVTGPLGRGIRVEKDGTITDISTGYRAEQVEEQAAINELFGLEPELIVFDEVATPVEVPAVLDRPLKRQDIFDVEAITSKLRHKSPRNQRRAIEKAFKKRSQK